MKQRWEDYDQAADRGPLALGIKIVLGVAALSMLVWGISHLFSAAEETAQVAQEQFGAQALLTKYEWFKDASAQLDAKVADMAVYQRRFKTLQEAYDGSPRSKWSREDREQFNIWASELAGIKASYNGLAAEYNSQMSKFNYRFTNAGQLPAGATVPLPREYKPYQEQ